MLKENEIKENQITSEIEGDKVLLNDELNEKSLVSKLIAANVLDQLIMIAGSAVLLFLIDLIMRKAFGYMFVRENGALVLAGGIIYFIENCIYTPIMEKTKLENTIAKKILNLN